MAERDRRGIAARIDRTNHVLVPINVIAPAGAIAAPHTVINAVVDALRSFGVEHIDIPATPEKVWAAMRTGAAAIERRRSRHFSRKARPILSVSGCVR